MQQIQAMCKSEHKDPPNQAANRSKDQGERGGRHRWIPVGYQQGYVMVEAVHYCLRWPSMVSGPQKTSGVTAVLPWVCLRLALPVSLLVCFFFGHWVAVDPAVVQRRIWAPPSCVCFQFWVEWWLGQRGRREAGYNSLQWVAAGPKMYTILSQGGPVRIMQSIWINLI